MLKPVDFYIDLGTANTLIYARKRGFLLNEPSILAVKEHASRKGQLFALGRPAKLMLGKNPSNLAVVRPLREGVIADFDSTAKMLHAFIRRIRENTFWFRPRMIISLPCQVSEFEKRAVEQVGYELGASKVHLLDEPVAAAIGANLPVLTNRGHMVVDIGGGTTEIAIISLGGIVASRAVRIGGNHIDEAIIDHVRSKFNFVIGEQTAERIKIQIGSPLASFTNALEIGGINLLTGLPGRLKLSSNAITPAVEPVCREILQAIRQTLEQAPPEISADISEDGIVLAGGGALLRGISSYIQSEIGIKVRITQDPLLSVALGGAKALEDSKLFDVLERPA